MVRFLCVPCVLAFHNSSWLSVVSIHSLHVHPSHVLTRVSVQVSYLLSGLFTRACKSLGSSAAVADIMLDPNNAHVDTSYILHAVCLCRCHIC